MPCRRPRPARRGFRITSHELRTPLNAIIGFSDIMRQELFGPLGDPRYLRYAELVHESGSRLLDMINDFLDLSKLDAGKLELNTQTIEVLRVIVDSVRELEVLAAKSHVCFSVHVFDGVSLAGRGRQTPAPDGAEPAVQCAEVYAGRRGDQHRRVPAGNKHRDIGFRHRRGHARRRHSDRARTLWPG